MSDKPDEKLIEEGAQKITDQDVEKVVYKSEEIKKRFLSKIPLKRFVEDGQLLVSVVMDYWSGMYREIPYGTITAIVFTLIYILNPLDLVPDILPIIGQVDDAAVVSACLLLVERDLKKYKTWKQGRTLA